MTTLQDRIAELMAAMNWEHADLMRVSGQSSSVVSQWRGVGKGKIIQSIGKMEAAEAIEKASGYSALWVAKGMGPKRATDWTPAQHSPKGVSAHPVAHDLIHPQPEDEPTTCTWEFILSAVILPARFRLAVPDDALAPSTPKGTVLIFAPASPPVFGHGVLVEDAAGQRYVRKYGQGPGGRWLAVANNAAYLTLDSADGVRVLAAVVGRETGEV